ncbi:hypothetical protein H0H92_009849, partial [Tricholoma furcatifolium]
IKAFQTSQTATKPLRHRKLTPSPIEKSKQYLLIAKPVQRLATVTLTLKSTKYKTFLQRSLRG